LLTTWNEVGTAKIVRGENGAATHLPQRDAPFASRQLRLGAFRISVPA
jgi:hypothetical protein